MQSFLKKAKEEILPKPKAVPSKIIRITPGKRHAWCESDVGIIRKPLNSIRELLRG